MSSSESEHPDYAVACVVEAGHTVQSYIQSLGPRINLDAILAEDGWTPVDCDASDVLDSIKEEFKREFRRSRKMLEIVTAFVFPPTKPYSIANLVQLLAFQSGWSDLGNNCSVLIPVVMKNSFEATVKSQTSECQTTITFVLDSEVMISANSLIWIPEDAKVVCVLLRLA